MSGLKRSGLIGVGGGGLKMGGLNSGGIKRDGIISTSTVFLRLLNYLLHCVHWYVIVYTLECRLISPTPHTLIIFSKHVHPIPFYSRLNSFSIVMQINCHTIILIISSLNWHPTSDIEYEKSRIRNKLTSPRHYSFALCICFISCAWTSLRR